MVACTPKSLANDCTACSNSGRVIGRLSVMVCAHWSIVKPGLQGDPNLAFFAGHVDLCGWSVHIKLFCSLGEKPLINLLLARIHVVLHQCHAKVAGGDGACLGALVQRGMLFPICRCRRALLRAEAVVANIAKRAAS